MLSSKPRRLTLSAGATLLHPVISSPASGQETPLEAMVHTDEDGFSASLDYWVEGLSSVVGGLGSETIGAGLANLNLDYRRGRLSFHANVYGPHGDSITEAGVGDFSVVSNIDTVNDPRLQELWFEATTAGASSLRLGMLAADTEFWGTAYGGLFVNSVFGAPTAVSGNLPGPSIFPVATLGLRYAKSFASGTTVRAALLDGDA